MTYTELYNLVYGENKAENPYNGKYDGIAEKYAHYDKPIEVLARTIYYAHYNGVETVEDAVVNVAELQEEMTGKFYDPTAEEMEQLKESIENPNPLRIRRALLDSMRKGKLFDFITQYYNYCELSRNEFVTIIKEIDYAMTRALSDAEYNGIMNNAADEIKEIIF